MSETSADGQASGPITEGDSFYVPSRRGAEFAAAAGEGKRGAAPFSLREMRFKPGSDEDADPWGSEGRAFSAHRSTVMQRAKSEPGPLL